MKAMLLPFLAASIVGLGASGAPPTAADFLPVTAGGSTKIAEPQNVTVAKSDVTAASAQDAINAAVQANTKDLGKGDTVEVGAKMIHFPSGVGFVASGLAAYRTMENPVATRIAQRKAYVAAFVQAKKNLAEILGGLSVSGRETVREALLNVNLPKEEMTNISTQSEESLRQAVDMMLRGFVIYEVKDDPKTQVVFVSIVTTPKTRGQVSRMSGNALGVADMASGLEDAISEIKSGVVPPIGGKVLRVSRTGDLAFVGFGSAVVRTSENSAVQAKLNLDAQKVSRMRASDALCGLIRGDRTVWEGGVTEKHRDEVREFEEVEKTDPIRRTTSVGVQKLEKARQDFVATIQSTDTYTSARNDVLPPGIAVKTWPSDDGAWFYSMAVFTPALSAEASKAAREMALADPISGPTTSSPRKPDGSGGFTDEKNPAVPRPGTEVKQGPTGSVYEEKPTPVPK